MKPVGVLSAVMRWTLEKHRNMDTVNVDVRTWPLRARVALRVEYGILIHLSELFPDLGRKGLGSDREQ